MKGGSLQNILYYIIITSLEYFCIARVRKNHEKPFRVKLNVTTRAIMFKFIFSF
jgi:hypothetical protein